MQYFLISINFSNHKEIRLKNTDIYIIIIYYSCTQAPPLSIHSPSEKADSDLESTKTSF